MDKIEAFILDLDGVITETAEYHYQAWRKLAQEEGIPFNRHANEQLRGVSRRRSLELILGDRLDHYSEEEVREMMARKNNYYQEFLDQMTSDEFIPGARELISGIKTRGLKIAIGSASKNTRTVLENLDIIDQFDAIADGYSAERAKPAPDIFLYAARELNVEPQSCVVVEDAQSGIAAALAAGMIAVGVGPEERVGKAHYVYRQTRDIELDKIIEAGGR